MQISRADNNQVVLNVTFYSIVVLFLCCCFQFYKYLLQVYPSVITNELMTTFDLSGAGLGNLAASFYYSFLITQLFVGIVLDKFKAQMVASTAIFIAASGIFLFSYSTTGLEACLSRALMGVGVAFTTVTFMKLAAVWFPNKYYPFVSSLVATSTTLGIVCGQMPLAKMINILGWRHCLWSIGIIGFILAFIFFLTVRDKPNTNTTFNQSEPKFNWRDILIIIRNPNNWLLMIYSGLVFSPLAVFAGLWGIPFLKEAYHLNTADSGFLVSIAITGFGIGSPVLGILSSWIGNMRAVMISFTLISVLALCIVIYSPEMPNYLLGTLLFIFGFCLGTYMLVFSAGRVINPPHITATVIAFINMGDILTCIGDPLIGKILDLTSDGTIINGTRHFTLSNYHIAMSVLPLYLIVSTFLLLFYKPDLKNKNEIL